MKPLYLLLIFYALFITAFADMLELAFTVIIPGAGIAIGMPLAMIINITMGSGLVFLLAINGMFHPTFGPAGIIASVVPGLDSLPIWLALVITAILQDIAKEKKGLTGVMAGVTSSAISLKGNPLTAAKNIQTATQAVQNKPQTTASAEAPQRAPLNLKSPRMIDVKAPVPHTSNNNQPYAPKAA